MALPDVLELIIPKGSSTDDAPFCCYPLALLLHAEYVSIEPLNIPEFVPEEEEGRLGKTPMVTAKKLSMIADSRGSVSFRKYSIFITPKGRFKLEEIEKEKLSARRLLAGWVVALGIAIIAASVTAYLRFGGHC